MCKRLVTKQNPIETTEVAKIFRVSDKKNLKESWLMVWDRQRLISVCNTLNNQSDYTDYLKKLK